jgi:hypothetical protein
MAGEDNYDKIIAYIILVVLLPFSRVASYSALFRSPFPRYVVWGCPQATLIRVLPDGFLLKAIVLRYVNMNIPPPPPSIYRI